MLSLSDSGREIAAVGNLSGVQAGETLRLTGQWTTHRKFGEQFQVSSFTAVTPATVAGIERYLGSGLVPGVGKEIASRLVKKFGADTLHVIDEGRSGCVRSTASARCAARSRRRGAHRERSGR